MSERDPAIPLRHMRDAARRAVKIAQPMSRPELYAGRVETLALTRLIEIIGEAARRVPDSLRDQQGEIAWRRIVGTRDPLIHGYDRVDLDILWTIVHEQLPRLVTELDAVLRQLEEE